MTLEEMKDRTQFGHVLNHMGLTGVGVELGVFKGEFSSQILKEWRGSKLIGVDSYNNGVDFHLLCEAILINILSVVRRKYEIIVNTTEKAAGLVQDELDFVFVDADHTYPAVYEDILRWYPKIKKGGVLCGHDYDELHGGVLTGVGRFVEESQPWAKPIVKECGSWFIRL